MSFDLCMNDTCPKCRKLIKLAAVNPHPTSPNLAVQKFECSDCGPVTTRMLFRKPPAACRPVI
jgi:hypothetical protein